MQKKRKRETRVRRWKKSGEQR